MNVFVLSKFNFDNLMSQKNIFDNNVEDYTDTIFISINNTVTDEVPHFSKDMNNVKILYFDDVENDVTIPILGTDTFSYEKAFTIDQAKDLIKFLDKQKNKKTCLVHCAAGISRSGAIGTFINDYFGGDWNDFKKINSQIQPNGLVLSLLNRVMRSYN